MGTEVTELTVVERCKYDNLNVVIAGGLKHFVDVGRALAAVRDERLYRCEFATFEDYCRDKWSLKRQRAYELIQAAAVAETLSEISDKRPKESHAAELSKLDEAEQPEAWQEAVETAPDGKVTAKHVQAVVDRRRGVSTDTEIDEAVCEQGSRDEQELIDDYDPYDDETTLTIPSDERYVLVRSSECPFCEEPYDGGRATEWAKQLILDVAAMFSPRFRLDFEMGLGMAKKQLAREWPE